MLKKSALIYGIVVLIIGVGGFLPFLVTSQNDMGMGLLLGIFMVGPLHNVIHLVTGAAAIGAASSAHYARVYFQVLGIVYTLVAILGFMGGDNVLGILPVNLADNYLHVAFAALGLGLGFGTKTPAKADA